MSQQSTQLPEIVLLLSGGIDSTACLEYYRENRRKVSEVLFVDYGQSSAFQEFASVKKISRHYKTKLSAVSVSGLGSFRDGFISGRNALLLVTALMTFKYDTGLVSIGIHSGTSYSDCSETFVTDVQRIFDIYCDGRITIDTPFISWSKAEIFEFCKLKNVPIELTYSCEIGKLPVCGQCLSCLDVRRLYESK